MTDTQWQELIFDFCLTNGLPRPQDLLENGLLVIEGMHTAIAFDGEESGRLSIRFDVDTIPPASKSRVFEALMMSNYICGIGGACVWSCHPTNSTAVCSYSVLLAAETTGQQLAEALQDAARNTKKMWSNTLAVIEKSSPGGLPMEFI
ncbi:CesT family type III secretion system chaperone [Duganella qianjiadongensis]|uniref:Tir chaperone protein (CesT) family protein n=1 Tax=Duganella qianjiadongensis TaxID=2692176 RepID=A0ABW9VKR3_9BURK|nr:CesT family type III secretion system chaperone [Duganella qianjiadongensis]MYM40023.1 hypothetical protein [Duganella qianjiadongensis]